MEHRIVVAGIGPGNPDFVLPAARAAIEGAEVLVGGSRALADFAKQGQETMTIRGDIDAVLSFIREKIQKTHVVVMVSGDPGYYSLLDALRREFPPQALVVIPGVSSLQMAFARLALPWHAARLLSFHGREPHEAELLRTEGAVLGMLTDGRNNSQTIATRLMAHGWSSDDTMYVCTRLSYADEQITEMTIGQAADTDGIGHGVIIVCTHEEKY